MKKEQNKFYNKLNIKDAWCFEQYCEKSARQLHKNLLIWVLFATKVDKIFQFIVDSKIDQPFHSKSVHHQL